MRRTSVKPPSMVLDGLAELAVAAKLSASSPLSLNSMNTLPIAKTVTKEGMYGSYTVDIVDDSKVLHLTPISGLFSPRLLLCNSSYRSFFILLFIA